MDPFAVTLCVLFFLIIGLTLVVLLTQIRDALVKKNLLEEERLDLQFPNRIKKK